MQKAASLPNDRWVSIWLVLICVCVIAMVLVGGATRLTDSGLSITQWNLFKGFLPPLSERHWQEEFALYQRTTEYQVQNRGMAMDEFQYIYWWEWAHRFLGRLIGLLFFIPFVAFLLMGKLKCRVVPVLCLGLMGGLQGAIGWWMVTSGLFSGLDVSPIRLAIHLGMAFLILAFGAHLALDFSGARKKAGSLGGSPWLAFGFCVLLFCQVMAGALTAGTDSGAAYQDWPTIGGALVPDLSGPFLHNQAALQFLHRTLGYLTAAAALALAFMAFKRGQGRTRLAALHVGGFALLQALLGISVIVSGSHLGLSLTHQGGAVLLWLTSAITASLAISTIIPHTQTSESIAK
jgi:cytochrome c oxidase assembly protein subunit 15